MKVFSYGGGVQSTAALVLAAQGRIDYKTFLFCNVGGDSENPATLEYMFYHARPYAEKYGIQIIELQKVLRNGMIDTVFERTIRTGGGIPVRMNGNGAPSARHCTVDFKVKLVEKWLRENRHGDACTVGLGISLDEWQRMRSDSGVVWKTLDYPLIDLRIDRAKCISIIQSAGLPIPPKSSCWFCPFHSLRTWQDMRQNQPVLFLQASNFEAILNERRAKQGKDPIWFTRMLKPLEQVTTDLVQDSLFEDDACESGYCMV